MSILQDLTAAIRAVCPIDGVAAGPHVPKEEWEVWLKDEASIEEKAAAQAVIDNFDWAAKEAALEIIKATDTALVTEYESDQTRKDMIDRLMTATPAQIDAWLANNANTLAKARDVLAMILKILAILIRKVK